MRIGRDDFYDLLGITSDINMAIFRRVQEIPEKLVEA